MEEYYAEIKNNYSSKKILPLNPNHYSDTLFSTRTLIPFSAAKQNHDRMKSILPSNTIFITDLTDSVSYIESKFKQYSHSDVNETASLSIEDVEKFFHIISSQSNPSNKQLYQFRHSLRKSHLQQNFSTELTEKIHAYNNVDELLYNHFNDKLTRHTGRFGKD